MSRGQISVLPEINLSRGSNFVEAVTQKSHRYWGQGKGKEWGASQLKFSLEVGWG